MGMVIMTSSKIHSEDKIPDFLGDPVTKNPPADAGVREDSTCGRTARPTCYVCTLYAQSRLILSDPMGCQAPLSMGFSRQEHWSGLPFPTPEDLPDSGNRKWVSFIPCFGRWILYHCTTWEACGPQLLSLCSRAWEPQLLKPLHPTACAPKQEKPP